MSVTAGVSLLASTLPSARCEPQAWSTPAASPRWRRAYHRIVIGALSRRRPRRHLSAAEKMSLLVAGRATRGQQFPVRVNLSADHLGDYVTSLHRSHPSLLLIRLDQWVDAVPRRPHATAHSPQRRLRCTGYITHPHRPFSLSQSKPKTRVGRTSRFALGELNLSSELSLLAAC